MTHSTEVVPFKISTSSAPVADFNWTSINASNYNCEILVIDYLQLTVRRTTVATTPVTATLEARLVYQAGFWSSAAFLQAQLGEGADNAVGVQRSVILPVSFPIFSKSATDGDTTVEFHILDTSIGGQCFYTINGLLHVLPYLAPQTDLSW